MEVQLTKSAKHSLAILFNAYEARRKAGAPKSAAIYFGNGAEDGAKVKSAISEDVPELKAAGLIACDVLGGVTIKDAAIVYMENKTANTIKEWLSFGAQFIP